MIRQALDALSGALFLVVATSDPVAGAAIFGGYCVLLGLLALGARMRPPGGPGGPRGA